MSYLQTSGSQIGTKICCVSLQTVFKYIWFGWFGFKTWEIWSVNFAQEKKIGHFVTQEFRETYFEFINPDFLM